MFTTRTHRPAIVCALACALFASVIGDAAAARANEQTRSAAALAQERYYSSYGGDRETIDAGALARANGRTQSARALAQERYYSSIGGHDKIDAGASAAPEQERYYSSYGEPEPLSPRQAPVPSDDTPWLAIALSVAVSLAVVAASATQLRRLRVSRRAARVTT